MRKCLTLNGRSDPSRKHREGACAVALSRLHKDLPFLRAESERIYEADHEGYEIELINYCLRIVINHYKKPFDLNYKSAFFDRYSQISIGKLITARTTDELVENLKETEYYAPLKK